MIHINRKRKIVDYVHIVYELPPILHVRSALRRLCIIENGVSFISIGAYYMPHLP
jgi:hypothetical protein